MIGNLTCEDIVLDNIHGINYVSLVIGILQTLPFVIVFIWQQYWLPRRANAGDKQATMYIVLPTYILLLYAIFVAWLGFGLVNVLYTVRLYPDVDHTWRHALATGVTQFAYHFVMEGLAFFLCMRGAGWKSLSKAAVLSTITSLVYGGLQAMAMLTEYWSSDMHYGFIPQLGSEAFLFLFYLVILITPRQWLHRRPAALILAAIWTIYRPIFVANILFMYYDYEEAFCSYIGISWFIWGIAKPFLLLKILQIDSQYWLGATQVDWYCCQRQRDRAAVTPRDRFSDLEFEPEVASLIASEMDILQDEWPLLPFTSIEILSRKQAEVAENADVSELHRALIDARHKELDQIQTDLTNRNRNNSGSEVKRRRLFNLALLGGGGQSNVYQGYYKNRQVAVKTVVCTKIEPQDVHNFCQENTFQYKMKHPCIVELIGVCIIPPVLCSVFELCRESLKKHLEALHGRHVASLLSLSLAIDCADSLACLHEQQPPIIHQDIKSLNFLIGINNVKSWRSKDVQNWIRCCGIPEASKCFKNVRGWHRKRHKSLLHMTQHDVNFKCRTLSAQVQHQVCLAVSHVQESYVRHSKHHYAAKLTDFGLSRRSNQTVADFTPDTAEWAAPEIIENPADQSEASDVYALTIVLWEILCQREPFQDSSGNVPTPDEIRSMVLQGQRPELDCIPVECHEILRVGWHQDPHERWSARRICNELVDLYRRIQRRGVPETAMSIANLSIVSGISLDRVEADDFEDVDTFSVSSSIASSFLSESESASENQLWSVSPSNQEKQPLLSNTNNALYSES